MSPHFTYILVCRPTKRTPRRVTFYIGKTSDISKRFQAHLSGKGARRTKMLPPRGVGYLERFPNNKESVRGELSMKKSFNRLSYHQKGEFLRTHQGHTFELLERYAPQLVEQSENLPMFR